MKIVFDWIYYCFYCLAFSKGMKYERASFGMNISFGFYISALVILLISKLHILENLISLVILFFGLTVVIFYLLDHYIIEKRRYRIAIDRFLYTPKFLKVLYGILALIIMLSNFFVILFVAGLIGT